MEPVMKNGPDIINRQSLSEQVEDLLREEITIGRVCPGDRVDVATYQKNWNVSSTPFRDALRALEAQGFVTIEPRKGVYVASMNDETLREIFDLRIALECMAVELATPRIPEDRLHRLLEAQTRLNDLAASGKQDVFEEEDTAVHDIARDYCGNSRIERLLIGQRDLFRWAQNTIIAEIPHSYALAFPEHLEIAMAYLARDVSAARDAMRSHLEKSRDRLVARRGS